MKTLGKIGAFLLGSILAVLVVGILDDTFPWFWLPLLGGLAVGFCALAHRWLTKTTLAGPYAFACCLGICTSYSITSKAVTTRLGPLVPLLATLCLVSALAFSILKLVMIGYSQPSSRSLTSWLVIPIIGCLVVGMVSGGVGGSDHMVVWLLAHTHLTKDRAEEIIHYFRKGIHLSAYGIVGLSLSRAAICGKATRIGAWVFALSTVLCLATFDEIRQTTAPNRTGSAWDVALDMTGAVLFISSGMLISRNRGTSKLAQSQ